MIIRIAAAGLLLGLAVTPTYAATSDLAMKVCRAQTELAEIIMTKRQRGVPMLEILDTIDSRGLDRDGTMKQMIVEAYKGPRFNTSRHQQKAVTDFADEMLLACIQNI